jgi:hypothetical protein
MKAKSVHNLDNNALYYAKILGHLCAKEDDRNLTPPSAGLAQAVGATVPEAGGSIPPAADRGARTTDSNIF